MKRGNSVKPILLASGIYHIYDDQGLAYVGASKNLAFRLNTWVFSMPNIKKFKVFDCPIEKLAVEEARHIKKYAPRLNVAEFREDLAWKSHRLIMESHGKYTTPRHFLQRLGTHVVGYQISRAVGFGDTRAFLELASAGVIPAPVGWNVKNSPLWLTEEIVIWAESLDYTIQLAEWGSPRFERKVMS